MEFYNTFLLNTADTYWAHPNFPQLKFLNWEFPSVDITPSIYPHTREKNSQENK
jgi:hypothetical protein